LYERESAILRQRSRVDWLEKGDLKSKNFQSRLRWRRLNNDIKGLLLDGEWCKDRARFKNEVRGYFKSRLRAQQWLGLKLDGV